MQVSGRGQDFSGGTDCIKGSSFICGLVCARCFQRGVTLFFPYLFFLFGLDCRSGGCGAGFQNFLAGFGICVGQRFFDFRRQGVGDVPVGELEVGLLKRLLYQPVDLLANGELLAGRGLVSRRSDKFTEKSNRMRC